MESLILKYLVIITTLLNIKHLTHSVLVKFTKFECQAFDEPFADIALCNLKVLGRDKVALNMHVRLYQVPVNNVSVNAAFLIKGYTQIYSPFLYNSTMDICRFMKNPNNYQFWKIIYQIIRPSSNINHTCPFNHDIIIRNMTLNPSTIKMIPFPTGDYLVKLRIMAYNQVKAEIRAYVLIQE